MQYRKIVMPALAPGRLSGIEERVKARCAQLIAKIPLNATVDVVPLLSAPLPLLTLAELLDVPSDMWLKLYDWTNAFVGEDDPDFRRSSESMTATLGEFFAFARDLFERRRATPGVDLASVLANATIDGAAVSFRQSRSMGTRTAGTGVAPNGGSGVGAVCEPGDAYASHRDG